LACAIFPDLSARYAGNIQKEEAEEIPGAYCVLLLRCMTFERGDIPIRTEMMMKVKDDATLSYNDKKANLDTESPSSS
jgi:hypothetical protein